MTPEAGDYLAKGRQDLSDGREILQISLANVAARSAYFAVFHAAEAFIFEKTGRIAKTHRGVRIEFARLAKDDPRIAKTLPEFLAQAYRHICTRRLAITAWTQMKLSRCRMPNAP
jgi:uncharacterized protein (UPF0332 family)